MNTISRTYDITLRTLTPIYIGGALEKNWVSGVDYICIDKKVYIINQEKLFKVLGKKEIQYYTLKLKDGQATEFLTERIKQGIYKLSEITSAEYSVQFPINEDIKAFICNGFGLPYIPGSSLKGAIRSAILGYLYKNNPAIKLIGVSKDLDNLLFGEKKEIDENDIKRIIDTHESIMRFIQVTDAHFSADAMQLYNTKIYSLKCVNNYFNGAWKHKRSGSKPEFDDSYFVSTYECIDINQTSTLRINITEQIIKLLNNNIPIFTEKVISLTQGTDPLMEIFRMINNQTRSYLEKEIEFFKQHQGDKSDIIVEQLESLKKIVSDFITNEKDQHTLIHLGSGSGFHGLTGDWQFNSHIINGIKQGSDRGLINGKDAAKTRRLIFSKSKDNDYVFTPMGFVVLSMNEISEDNLKTHFFKNKIKVDTDKTNKSTSQTSPQEFTPPQPYKGKIIQGQTVVPAIVVKSGRPNIVQLLIEGENVQLCLNGYASEIKEGNYIFVKVDEFSKNEIRKVSFKKFHY